MSNEITGVDFEEVPKVQLPKKMSYFNVKEAYYALFNELEDNGGELTEELDFRMQELDIKLEDKMHSIYFIKKEKEAAIDLIKDEIKRLSTKVKSIDTTIAKIKEIGLDAVLTFGTPGKSGNKTLKYPDLTCFTTNRESLVVPENLTDAIAYGNSLLGYTIEDIKEGDELEIFDENNLFKYELSFKNLTAQQCIILKDILNYTTLDSTDLVVSIINNIYPEVITQVNTDEIRKRINLNKATEANPNLFTEGETSEKELLNVLDYSLITKPSITFK